ncbi:hypothetical protein [Legionella jamestowniensis]|nr:hypothetical protein [Legionella jamestowniensis]
MKKRLSGNRGLFTGEPSCGLRQDDEMDRKLPARYSESNSGVSPSF